jgi:long-chain acyl-CoA synthetase
MAALKAKVRGTPRDQFRNAERCRTAGVGKGSRVAHLDRSAPEIVELLFATSKLGAVTVPLNWRLAPAELAAVVADAQPAAVIAGEAYADVAAPNVVVVGPEYERWLAAHEPVDPGGRGEPGDTVLQLYTSGTTGVPKGVLTTHRNLAAAAESSPRWEFDADTISMTPLVPMADASRNRDIVPTTSSQVAPNSAGVFRKEASAFFRVPHRGCEHLAR